MDFHMIAGLSEYYNGQIPEEVWEGIMKGYEVEPDTRTSKEKCIDTLKTVGFVIALIVNMMFLCIPMIIYFAIEDANEKKKERKIAEVNRQKTLKMNEQREIERVERGVAAKKAQKARQKACLVDLRAIGQSSLKRLNHEGGLQNAQGSIAEVRLAEYEKAERNAQWWETVTTVAKGAVCLAGAALMAWKSPDTLRSLVTGGVTLYPR